MVYLSRQRVYAEDLPGDDISSLSQCPSHSVVRDPALHEYSSSSCSPDVSNSNPVAASQCHSNGSTYCNGSRIVSESAEQKYPIRQESKSLSKVSKHTFKKN